MTWAVLKPRLEVRLSPALFRLIVGVNHACVCDILVSPLRFSADDGTNEGPFPMSSSRVCRTVFTENKSGPIAIYETDQMHYSLAIYRALSLTPKLGDGIIRSIHLGSCSYTEAKRSEVFGGWRDLKHSIVAVFDGSAFSTAATARHGAIVRAAANVLRGCPYYPPSAARSIHKWRTKLVNLVCTPETIGSVAALAREVASRPRLFTVVVFRY